MLIVLRRLVVIVDRAKNLPNRKTIGKQDPYCAARLGKEAKKTETDRRGGQTPRWYAMRYPVAANSADSTQGPRNAIYRSRFSRLLPVESVSVQ